MVRGVAIAVLLVMVACGGDARLSCEELEDIGEVTVDTTSGTPVFGWKSGVEVETIDVLCDEGGALVGQWSVSCSAPHADPPGEPLGTTCIPSPVTYGEDPEGAYTEDPDYYTAAKPLPSRAACTVRVSTRCRAGNGQDGAVESELDFEAP